MDDITFETIGYIETPYTEDDPRPCQNYKAPDVIGRVVVNEAFAGGLRDIETFSHLYLFFIFHKLPPLDWKPLVTPYLTDEQKGVFATRTPRRPNPFGMTTVKLIEREDNVLIVEGVDMIDGSPLIDIKPYVVRFDHREDANSGWIDDM